MTNDERKTLIETEQRSKTNTHAISELKDSILRVQEEQRAIHDINTNIQLMAQSMTAVKEDIVEVKEEVASIKTDVKADISDVKQRVEKAERKPEQEDAKNYNSIKNTFIQLATTGIIAFILGQIAPNIFK